MYWTPSFFYLFLFITRFHTSLSHTIYASNFDERNRLCLAYALKTTELDGEVVRREEWNWILVEVDREANKRSSFSETTTVVIFMQYFFYRDGV